MKSKALLWVMLPVVTLLMHPSVALGTRIVLDSEKQMEFVRYYMEREEYDRAAQELERLTYFFPDDPLVPEARYMTGWCYLKLQRFDRARKILWEVYESYNPLPPSGRTLYLIGESYRLQGLAKEAVYYFERVQKEFSEAEIADEARYRLGWMNMEAGNWHEASRSFQTVRKESHLRDKALSLAESSLDGLALPRKSPAAAGLMAGVLPGLGHAYCGRYHDAAVSLILNGTFAWAAFEAFDNDLEVLGGILGFLGLSFYSGNIYSAVNCAHKYNEHAKRGFLKSLHEHLGVYSSGKGLGLGLHFRF